MKNKINLSFSLIKTYLQCPKKAIFSLSNNILKKQDTDTTSLTMGDIVHRLICIQLCKISIQFENEFSTKIENLEEMKHLANNATNIFNKYEGELIACEKRLVKQFDDYNLVGVLDAIKCSEGDYYIFDWKTNNKKFSINTSDYELQANLYMYLLSQNISEFKNIYCVFCNLKFENDILTFKYNQEKDENMLQMTENIAKSFLSKNIKFLEGDGDKESCDRCDYSDFCKILC